jgi:DegV family protein with EDD domain
VVDTLSTSVALQLMVYAAADAIRGGAALQEVTQQMEAMKARIYTLFVVDTLEYLAKGGRIGNAKALLGTMLSIKPILILKDGAIEPLEQVRSKRKAVARMLDLIQDRVGSAGRQARLSVTHALAPEEADAVRQELVTRLGCPEPYFSELGAVIGSHTGPGVVAVATYV